MRIRMKIKIKIKMKMKDLQIWDFGGHKVRPT